MKLFDDFLTKTEWKLAEIGGFSVVFEHPHFQAEKRVEKSRGKSKDFQKILPRRHKGAKIVAEWLNRKWGGARGERRETKIPLEGERGFGYFGPGEK